MDLSVHRFLCFAVFNILSDYFTSRNPSFLVHVGKLNTEVLSLAHQFSCSSLLYLTIFKTGLWQIQQFYCILKHLFNWKRSCTSYSCHYFCHLYLNLHSEHHIIFKSIPGSISCYLSVFSYVYLKNGILCFAHNDHSILK